MRLMACLLTAFAVVAPAAQAADRPLASIRTNPAIPFEGRVFDLIASSPGSGVTYSWDLDGDGAFGDATGVSVPQVFPATTRTVSVRATDAEGRTSTETRSVTAASTKHPPTITDFSTPWVEVGRQLRISASSWDEDGRIVAFEFDLDGDGTYERPGTLGNPEGKELYGWALATFDTPGQHLVRLRVTDDDGLTAVATATVHVTDSAPAASLSAYGDTFDHAPVAGEPATISATSARAAAKYEFDLDGDGVYELDKGTTHQFETTLTAGAHVLGARITDQRGGVLEQRITTFVYAPADTFPEKFFVRRFATSAVVGAPTDLVVNVEPYSYSYKVEWDADGDGDFDDGTHTSPGGDEPDSSLGHNTYTYTAAGVYDQRVRVSRAGLPTRIFSSRIYVGTQPVDRTPLLWLRTGNAASYGVPFRFFASLTWLNSSSPDAALSWDLDGDGEFDDSPAFHDTGYWWAFKAPVTVGLKATDRQTGASSVLTAQVQPPGLDATPAVTLNFGAGAASFVVDDASGARCCEAAWDTNGDGAYDNGTGAQVPVPTSPGEHSVGLQVTDDLGRRAFVRKTYTVPGADPVVPAAKPLKLTLRISKARLAAVLKRGLRVQPGCDAACRATVVVSADKVGAARSKPRAKALGRATGAGRTITVRLTAKAKRSLRHARWVKLRVAVTATALDGRAGSAGRALKLNR